MATFTISRANNSITINSYVDESPGNYQLSVDSLNSILVIKSDDGAFKDQIHCATDTITVNGTSFSGTASQLKTLLLRTVFSVRNIITVADQTAALALLGASEWGVFEYTDGSVNIAAKNAAGEGDAIEVVAASV